MKFKDCPRNGIVSKRCVEIELSGTIDDAVELLKKYDRMGEKVCTRFNGVMLYSDTVTLDGAYKAITGMTKAEFEQEREKLRAEFLAEEAEWEKNAPNEIQKWIGEGHAVLDEKYWDVWDNKCVPKRVSDIHHGENLGAALVIIKALNEGSEIKDALKILNGQGRSGASETMVLSMVDSFCDRGHEFREAKEHKTKKSKDSYER